MRETGPYFKRIPPGAEPYVKIAETILGAYKRQLGLLGLTQGTITRTLQDGTVIRVARFGGNDVIEIKPSGGAGEEEGVRFSFIGRPGPDTSVNVNNIAGAAFGYFKQAPTSYLDEVKRLMAPRSTGLRLSEPTDREYGATPFPGGVQTDTPEVRYRNTRLSRWGRNSGYAASEAFYEVTSYGPDIYYQGAKFTIPGTRIFGAGMYRRSLDNRAVIIAASASPVADGTFIGYFAAGFADPTGRAQWNGSNALYSSGVEGFEAADLSFYELYPDTGAVSLIGNYVAPGGWMTTGTLGAQAPNYGSDVQDIQAQNPPSWNGTYEVYQTKFSNQWLEFSPTQMKASGSMLHGSRIISSWPSHPSGNPNMGAFGVDGYNAVIEFTFAEPPTYEPADTGVLSAGFSYVFQDGATDDNSDLKYCSGYLSDGTHVRMEGWEDGFPFGNTFSGFRIKAIGGSLVHEEAFASPTVRPWTIWMDFKEDAFIYASSTPDPYSGNVSVLFKMLIKIGSAWTTVDLGSASFASSNDTGVGDVFTSYPGSVAVSGAWVLISLFGVIQCFDYDPGGTVVEMVDWTIHKLYNKETGVLLDLGADKAWGVAAL